MERHDESGSEAGEGSYPETRFGTGSDTRKETRTRPGTGTEMVTDSEDRHLETKSLVLVLDLYKRI